MNTSVAYYALLLIVGAVTEVIPALVIIGQEPAEKTAQVVAENGGIFVDPGLRAWCVIGAFLGGLLAVTAGPPIDAVPSLMMRRMGVKFLASFVSGLLFTPLVFIYVLKISPNVDMTLAVSGSVAFVSVMTLHLFIPWWEKMFAAFLEKRAARLDLVDRLDRTDKKAP